MCVKTTLLVNLTDTVGKGLNTSMHNAVTAKILVDLHTSTQTTEQHVTSRVNWDKIDKKNYAEGCKEIRQYTR